MLARSDLPRTTHGTKRGAAATRGCTPRDGRLPASARRSHATAGVTMVGMTSNNSTPTLQPVPDEKNLLVAEETAGSCCGGGCCGGN
ncbi:hypothetical protein GCM10027411_05450 [Microbacterium aureliae]